MTFLEDQCFQTDGSTTPGWRWPPRTSTALHHARTPGRSGGGTATSQPRPLSPPSTAPPPDYQSRTSSPSGGASHHTMRLRPTLPPNDSLGMSTAGRRYRRGRVRAVPRGRPQLVPERNRPPPQHRWTAASPSKRMWLPRNDSSGLAPASATAPCRIPPDDTGPSRDPYGSLPVKIGPARRVTTVCLTV
jgi:hypothetical protein